MIKTLKKNTKRLRNKALEKKAGQRNPSTQHTGQSSTLTHLSEQTVQDQTEKFLPKHQGNGSLKESLLVLEPRIMFDGAAVLTGAEVSAEADQQADATVDTNAENETNQTSEKDNQSVQEVVAAYSNPAERQEMVFIDTSVEDYQTLMASIDSNAEIVLLDPTRDGLEQIAEVLEGRSDIDAIHIVSHGDQAQLQLGTSTLTFDSMSGEHADELAIISQALSDEADFLIYGCNFGEGEAGQEAAAKLAELTGADIAASSDLTGNTDLGGDWDLEVKTGSIETVVAFSVEVQQVWSGVLADGDTTVTFQEGVDGYTGTQDTAVEEDTPTTSYGTQTTLEVDLSNSGGGQEQTLIRFDNLFGTGDGQIPSGATIISATLTLEQTDTSGSTATISLHRMLTSWSENSTWNSMTDGISTDDVEAASTADATIYNPETVESKVITGLGSTLQAWADGTATNYGWVIISDNTDGVIFGSSENGTTSFRPKLTVEYRTSGGDTTTGLTGQWTFDADATDSSGNSYNGTLTNGATIDTTDTTDQVGVAKLSLDGTDDYVDLDSHISNFSSLTEGTISAWIKTTGTNQTIFSISDTADSNSYATLFVGGSGYLTFEVYESGVAQLATYNGNGDAINDGNWHHVAVTVDTSGHSLYIDGQKVSEADLIYDTGSASTSKFFSDVTGLDAMAIGRNENNSGGRWHFNGLLDDVRVYNQALTVADLAAVAAEAPVAYNDTSTTTKNTAVNIDLTANDTDLDSETITVLDVSDPTNGTVVNNEDGTVTYTPDSNYTGTDSFTYLTADLDDTTNYWRLDGDGTDAVGSNDGTLTGTTTVDGVYGDALSFDEVDDKVVVSDFAINNEFSLTFKFKVDDNSGSLFQYIYSHGDVNNANSLNIFLGEDSHGTDAGILKTVIRDTDDSLDNDALDFDVSHIIGDGQWHTYTLTVSAGAGSKVYLDGVLKNTDTRGGDSFNPTTDIYFGAREDLDASRFYGGSLDSVQLFNRALNAEEVNDTHTGGSSLATVNVLVNDPPVNSVPGAQSVDEDTTLTFNSANSNLISISDGDVGSNPLRVTLTATNGTMTLSQTTGLTFSTGDGTSDATMVFEGTLTNINAALDGLQFLGDSDFNGTANIQITTDDLTLTSLNEDTSQEGYYTFDDTGNLGNDSSQGANHGTVNGAMTNSDATRGNVLEFDGTNDNVEITGLMGSPADVTLAAWVNLDSGASDGEIISIGDYVAIRADESGGEGVQAFFYDGSTWHNLDSGTYISGTGWHHVAYIFDDTSNTQTLYIDGIVVATGSRTESITYSGQGSNTFIGQHGNATSYNFDGKIDDARIFDRVLTTSEIQSLAFEPTSTDTDNISITVNAVNDAPTDLSNGIELNTDGGNDAYLISDTGLSQSLSATTVEILFAANDTPTETVFISFNNPTGDELSLQINDPSNSLEIDFGAGTTVNASAIDYRAALVDGTVHSLSVTWDSTAGDWAIYIDGVFIESGTGLSAGSSLDTTNGQFVFGQEQDGQNSGYDSTQYFSGTFYDVRIWNDVRTAGEISQYYQQQLDLTPAEAAAVGLVANWQMDGFDGSSQVVDIVSGNNLSIAHASGTGFTTGNVTAQLSIDENSTNGSHVGFVTTQDPDASETFSYSLTDSAGGRFAVNASTGEITVANGSLLDYESSTSHNITVRVTDSGGLTYDEVLTIQVNDLEDAPVNTVPGAQSTNEDTTLTFNAANSNLISIADDAGETLVVTVAVNNGTVTLSGTTGLTFTTGDGTADATMTFSGTVEDINTALDGLQYDPTADYSGSDTLTLTSYDQSLYSLDFDANLQGYYTFDNTGDLGNDDSPGGSHDGTVNGAVTNNDATRGNVLSLDGNDDYVDITGAGALFGSPSDITLSAWVNYSSVDTFGGEVISLGNNVMLRVDDAVEGVTGVFYDGSTWQYVGSSTSLADGNWHHIAFTFDDAGNAQALYIDGVLAASDTSTASISYTSGSNTRIGANASDSDNDFDFNGLIDDVRIYDRALSASEIQDLASAPVTPSDTDAVAITVNAQNDAPVITNLASDNLAYTEGDGAVVIDQGDNATVTDVDSANFDTGTLTVSFQAGSDSAEDVLAIRNQGTGAGQIGVSGSNVTYQGVTIGTFTGGSGGTDLVITLNTSADATAVTALTKNITFENTDTTNPTTGARTVRYVLTDGDGGTSANYDATVSVVESTLVAYEAPFSELNDQSHEVKSDQAWGQTFLYDSPGSTYSVDTIGLVLYRASDASSQTITVSIRSTWNGATIASGTIASTSLSTSEAWVDVDLSSVATLNDNTTYYIRVETNTTDGKIYVGVDDVGTYADGTLIDKDGVADPTRDLNFRIQYNNDVPVITNLGGDTLAYTEGDGAQVIDQSTNAAVSDVDSSDFDTGTLTVAFTAGSDSAEDVLAIQNVGTGAGQIGVSGSNVTYAGTTIGTFTGGTSGSDLVITLNSSADATAVGALIQNITYENTDTDNPTTGSRTVRYVLTDGDGGTSANYDTTVTFTAVNDVPTITNLGGDTLAYTEGDGAQVIDQSTNAAVSDVDSSDFDTGTLTVAFTAGSDSAEDVLAIQNVGTGAGQIGVSGSNVTYAGTTIGTFTGGTSGSDLVITLNSSADATAVGALIQNITYENTDTDNPTTGSRTVRYVLTDGDGGTSANYDTTVTFTAVNDVPTITNLGGDTLAYTEGDGAQVIDQSTNAAVTDVDSSDFDTGTLTVAFTAGSDSAEDELAIQNVGTGAGQIGVSGSNVTYAGTTIGTFTGGTGGADLVITFNSNADATSTAALIQNITYENTDTDNPTTGSRTVRYVLTDGDGGTSANYDTTVAFTADNDVPVITNLGGDTLAYTEGDGAQVIDQSTNAAVSDVDSSDFDTGTLTVAFTAGSDSAEDVLAIQNVGTNPGEIGVSGSTVTYGGTTIGTFTGGTGGTDLVITFNSSADATAVGALVQNITYENTDTDAPTTGSRTVRYVLTDGDGGTSANYDTTVSFTAANDAPVLTPSTPTLTTITEDDTSNSGDLISAIVTTDITDVDSGAVEGIAITSLTSSNGTWEYNTGSGWTAVGTVTQYLDRVVAALDRQSLRFVARWAKCRYRLRHLSRLGSNQWQCRHQSRCLDQWRHHRVFDCDGHRLHHRHGCQ